MSDTLTTASAPETKLDILKVIEGIELSGKVNTDEDVLAAQVRSAVRRGHVQVRGQPTKGDRVCLVGSGPSLTDTLPELIELLREGAKLVTVNGSYAWALAHNLLPSAHFVMDARASNARFVDPPIPRCHYLIASTCHPDLWDRVAGRPNVWMWHPVNKTEAAGQFLDRYFLGQWQPVGGGTTIITRALYVLRILGYLRFDLFGVDSCWLHDEHHAFPQPENAGDKQYRVTVAPTGHPGLARTFRCSGWHLAQLQDILRILRVNGDMALMAFHGDGLIAHALKVHADLADAEIRETTGGV